MKPNDGILRACYYCGSLYGTTIIYSDNAIAVLREERDHGFPKSKGGVDDPENLISCCQVCNSVKRARTFGSHEEARGYVQSILMQRPIKRIIEPGMNYEEMQHEVKGKDSRMSVLQEDQDHEIRRQVLQRPLQSSSVSREESEKRSSYHFPEWRLHPCRQHNCPHEKIVVGRFNPSCVSCGCLFTSSSPSSSSFPSPPERKLSPKTDPQAYH